MNDMDYWLAIKESFNNSFDVHGFGKNFLNLITLSKINDRVSQSLFNYLQFYHVNLLLLDESNLLY